MIEVSGVSHAFGDRVVLHEVSAQLDEQRIGVIGANGSGKSTFVRLLDGLVLPDRGEVRVDGLDVRRHLREVRRRVGLVFTDPDAQIVMPTVAEDVALGLRRAGLTPEAVRGRVECILDRLGLSELADRPAHLLSSGQKQLLALASVLVTRPSTVICDEPTTLLDLRQARRIAAVLHSLPQRLIVVTHDLDLLTGFDRVLVFEDGRLVDDDSPEQALASYRAIMA